MAFVLEGAGQRIAEAFDGEAAAAPLLHIDWSPKRRPRACGIGPELALVLTGLGWLRRVREGRRES